MKSLIMSLLLVCWSVQALPEFPDNAHPRFKHGFIRINSLFHPVKTQLGSITFIFRKDTSRGAQRGIFEAQSLASQKECMEFMEENKKTGCVGVFEVTYLYSFDAQCGKQIVHFLVFRVEGLYHEKKRGN